MKTLLLGLAFIALSLSILAQDKQEVIQKGIEVKRSYDLNLADGDKNPSIEKEEFFDAKGNLIETKEYSDKGTKVKIWFKYKYDTDGNLIEESEFGPKGELKEKIVNKFNNGIKTEKLTYDTKGRLTKKRTYEYSFRK